MAESDADVYYGQMSAEMRQISTVAGDLYEALGLVGIPDEGRLTMLYDWWAHWLESGDAEIVIDDD